jgi:acyl-CoA dehydrogenase
MPIDFAITREQEELKAVAREFVEKTVLPRWKEMVEKEMVPPEIIREMGRIGLFGVAIPEKYGGLGLDVITIGLVLEELCRDPTGAIPAFYRLQVGNSTAIVKYGSEELKEEILPKAAKGDLIIGIGETEPGAGSDVTAISSTARKEGKEYVLNGEKLFISAVREAKEKGVWFKEGGGHNTIVYTDKSKGHRGLTLFFVPLTDPRITIRLEKPIGIGHRVISWGGFTMNDVRVPEHYRIGEEGRGFYILMSTFNEGRALIALSIAATTKYALQTALDYTKQRIVFGLPVATYQGIQFQLAEHWMNVEAAHALAYRALWAVKLEEEGKISTSEAALLAAAAKGFAVRVGKAALDDAMRWMTAYGYTIENPVAVAWSTIKCFDWAEGTLDIMKVVVARELIGREWLKKYRSAGG